MFREEGGAWKDKKQWPDVAKSLLDPLGICPQFTAKLRNTERSFHSQIA